MPSRAKFIKRKLRGEEAIVWEQFNLDTASFDPAMVNRRGQGPFQAVPIIQGRLGGAGTPDVVSYPRGALIGNLTQLRYAGIDPYQGSIVFWITPEWDGGDGLGHTLLRDNVANLNIIKTSGGLLRLTTNTGATIVAEADVSAWTAGTTYSVVIRWDSRNTLNGTNYGCISLNNVHTFYGTATWEHGPGVTLYMGSASATANAIIEGWTIYRRPLFDGTYGVRPMNGNQYSSDEIEAIYFAGAGRDPLLVTGPEDACVCVPTNSDDGVELVSGNGHVWSWPAGDNLLDVHGAWDGGLPGTDYAVEFNGSNTIINCGSDVDIDDIHDAEFTIDAWLRIDAHGAVSSFIATKVGWSLLYTAGEGLIAEIDCATTDALSVVDPADLPVDGKFHLITMHWDDANVGAARVISLAIDGVWAASYDTQTPGDGAIVTDVGEDLTLGNRGAADRAINGAVAWMAISDSDRHTVGTDFIPPRTPPADGANYLAIWVMDEGTGTAIDNIGDQGGGGSGPANRDGTLANGLWSSIWEQDATPVIPQSLECDGILTNIIVADAANIRDLQDDDLTVDIAFRADSMGEGNVGVLISKAAGDAGWSVTVSLGSLHFRVNAGTDSVASVALPEDKRWHTLRGTFSDGGDRKCRLYLDGILEDTGDAAVGAINSDNGIDLGIGCRPSGAATWDGAIGWVRLSDNLRSAETETAYVPVGRTNPPANDGNAHLLINMDDGAGAQATDTSGNTYHGTISDGVWNNTPDMEIDEPGAAIYGPKGYNLGSDAANDGMYIEQVVVAETDYAVFPVLSIGETGRARAQVRVYDVSNAGTVVTFPGPMFYGQHGGGNNEAELSHPTAKWLADFLIGWTVYNITDGSKATITSNTDVEVTGALGGGAQDDWDTNDYFIIRPPRGYNYQPWMESFCFQTPAGCTLLRVYIENPNGEGVMQFHQAQVLPNLLVNGDHESLTGGNPDLITNWTNVLLDAGDTESSAGGDAIIHSGAEAMQWNVGAIWGEYMERQITLADNKFFAFGGWGFGDGTDSIRHITSDALLQYSGSLNTQTPPVVAAWMCNMGVSRATSANPTIILNPVDGVPTGNRFTDDTYAIALDDVSLTVVPASAANSLEGTGIRIDGLDLVSDTPTLLRANQGNLEFGATPRRDTGASGDFGNLRQYMVALYEDANNYLILYTTTNNIFIRCVALGAGEINNNATITGDWDAGVRSVFRLRYGSGGIRLWRDGALVITVVGSAVFATAFSSIEWGMNQNGQNQFDGVISPA